jgi:hypothetical protein
MKTNNYLVPKVPTANIAVNKSRIKLYTKNVDMPTYYLEKGQEFQIELFNPTTDVVLARIILNNKAISQGGLVLNPGQRVFLDRYFDIAKKFLFDTYEVSNTAEVKEAIKNNGDIKIEFHKENKPIELNLPIFIGKYDWTYRPSTYYTNTIGTNTGGYVNYSNSDISVKSFNAGSSTTSGTLSTQDMFTNTSATYNADVNYSDTLGSMDMLSDSLKKDLKTSPLRSRKLSKSIETGRVEQGSHSDQKFQSVDKKFEYFPFHTIEYKMLPVSQKINTTEDVIVKRYCTNCGHKIAKTDKFCSQCSTKV